MMTLVIAFSLYVVEHLDMKYMQMNAFYLIMFRSVLSPMAGMAFSRTGYTGSRHTPCPRWPRR